jgi:hypothetical protein
VAANKSFLKLEIYLQSEPSFEFVDFRRLLFLRANAIFTNLTKNKSFDWNTKIIFYSDPLNFLKLQLQVRKQLTYCILINAYSKRMQSA